MELIHDSSQLRERLLRRISPGEFFALAFAFGMVGVFVWVQSVAPYKPFFDFQNYLKTAHGDYSFYYYGYWLLPVFSALAKLPLPWSYVLWCALNIAGVFLAARIFGGNPILAVLSYQMFYSLFQGQIAGVTVAGLALCWWGLVNRRWNIAGLGIALAAAKYQIGLTGCVLLLLLAEISWKERLRALILPALIVLGSLLVYPGWIGQSLHTLSGNPPSAEGSIALWRWTGPLALLFFLPPLVLPLTRDRRFIALVAATALALPYFQQTDLLFLLALPIGWIALLGNLGYLFVVYQWVALQALAILPLVVYGAALSPAVVGWIKSLKAGASFGSSSSG
jgi:hypothetical protein